jgi:hypothetical protein
VLKLRGQNEILKAELKNLGSKLEGFIAKSRAKKMGLIQN